MLASTAITPFAEQPFSGLPEQAAAPPLIPLMNRTLIVRLLWTSQLVGLAALVLWTAADPALLSLLDRLLNLPVVGIGEATWLTQFGQLRLGLFGVLLGVVALSFAGILIGMFRRSAQRSSLKSLRGLIALTAIAALWCGFALHRDTIAWQGKRLRIAWRIGELETLAQPLRSAFPDSDGELPRLGPFMAYPFGTPTVLILLKPPCVGSGELCVGAVQRGEQGDIKFQLTGADGGDWAEWHPESSQPRSFVGGLGDQHQLAASLQLGNGWYLVRYRDPAGFHDPVDLDLEALAQAEPAEAENTAQPDRW